MTLERAEAAFERAEPIIYKGTPLGNIRSTGLRKASEVGCMTGAIVRSSIDKLMRL